MSALFLWIPACAGMCGRESTRIGTRAIESQPLPQAGEQLNAGVAVGRLHADLALKVLHRKQGVVADAAVDPAGIEAERREALLNLLQLGQSRRALGAREFLHERRAADAAVAEMDERERIVHRRIVRAHRVEIRAEQK